jgi:hypothetical protein
MHVPPGGDDDRPAHPMRASIILVSAVSALVVLLSVLSTLR